MWPFTPKQKPRDKLMDHFSEEYLKRLSNERILIDSTILHLKGTAQHYVNISMQDERRLLEQSIFNLQVEKLQLTAKIDVIDQFLHG